MNFSRIVEKGAFSFSLWISYEELWLQGISCSSIIKSSQVTQSVTVFVLEYRKQKMISGVCEGLKRRAFHIWGKYHMLLLVQRGRLVVKISIYVAGLWSWKHQAFFLLFLSITLQVNWHLGNFQNLTLFWFVTCLNIFNTVLGCSQCRCHGWLEQTKSGIKVILFSRIQKQGGYISAFAAEADTAEKLTKVLLQLLHRACAVTTVCSTLNLSSVLLRFSAQGIT